MSANIGTAAFKLTRLDYATMAGSIWVNVDGLGAPVCPPSRANWRSEWGTFRGVIAPSGNCVSRAEH
jgi:hypothetical protein